MQALRESFSSTRSDSAAEPGEAAQRAGSCDEFINPLASNISAYGTDRRGRLRYFGESSTWSFSLRTLKALKDCIETPAAPDIPIREENRAYGLSWDRSSVGRDIFQILPSQDHSSYLVGTVKFRVGRIFHIFDEDDFSEHQSRFYREPDATVADSRLWFIQFLLILAFGKAFTEDRHGDTSLPGSRLFVHAMESLPDIPGMLEDRLRAVEIFCAIALYLQAADMRNSAYLYIGQALRLALSFGLHRTWDGPQEDVDRRRKIWFTVYILDRNFSSLMGNPTSIQDEDVTTSPPSSQSSVELRLHVRLSRLIAQVVDGVYGADGRLGRTFLTTTQSVLRNIADLAGEIQESAPLRTHASIGGISRAAAYLNLLYHHCVLVATRPVVFHLFRSRLITVRPLHPLSKPVKGLIRTCGDSAARILRILSILQEQDLLESFLPFDLESCYSVTFVLIMLTHTLSPDQILISSDANSLISIGDAVLQRMVAKGSVPASFRMTELQLFRELLDMWEMERLGHEETTLGGATAAEGGPTLSDANKNDLATGSLETFAMGGSMYQVDTDSTAHFLSQDDIAALAESLDFGGIAGDGERGMDERWLWDL